MTTTEEVLAHFGVRGMKWGVRKSPAAKAAKANRKLVRKTASGDRAWKGRAEDLPAHLRVYHDATKHMKKVEIPRLNNDRRFKGKDLKNNTALRQQYLREYSAAYTKALNNASANRVGTNPSGTKKLQFTYVLGEPLPRAKIVDTNLRHVDQEIPVIITWSDDWHILDATVIDPIAHGRLATQDALVAIGNLIVPAE